MSYSDRACWRIDARGPLRCPGGQQDPLPLGVDALEPLLVDKLAAAISRQVDRRRIRRDLGHRHERRVANLRGVKALTWERGQLPVGHLEHDLANSQVV